MEKIGLRRILVSDGPSGVRGEAWDERDPSLNLPSATALSSAWDPAIAYRYGSVSASEAHRKGVDVVLGPTINLHRSPYGGRHFEAFSEDPLLTAELAAAYVSGVQDNGVGATPKHYVANDFETDRFTVDVQVSDRALRELYLLAFEKAITEAKAWLVMSSYNSINGTTATENHLLETPLNTEWGFDGVVISDWTGVRSVESAKHSQDLAMPGPAGAWGGALVTAVRMGEVQESAIDRKVLRLLALAARVGALDGFESVQANPVPIEDGLAFAREAAAAGTVLVRNQSELPWSAETLSSVAVVGHNAKFARSQGGGSATVLPVRVISPLDGVREALPGVDVSYSIGAIVQEGVVELPLEQIMNPRTGEAGVLTRFLHADGTELFAEDRRSTALVWFGGDAPIADANLLELTTRYTPEESGEILLGFASIGHARIYVDDELVLDRILLPEGDDLGAAFLAPPSVSASVAVTAGMPLAVRVEVELEDRVGALANAMAFTFGLEPDDSDPDELMAQAVTAARDADVALVVVGTNSRVESEGYDRDSLALPGRQDELVRAVAAANPRTVVVVNSGSPVLLPWRNDVAAVLFSYFGGQEFGHALADVLLGLREPGGRLPTTWPKTEGDLPVSDVTPANGVVRYDEGIHIGYRAWLKAGTAPAYPFGHGMGYTNWELTDATCGSAVEPGGIVEVAATVTNTGTRAGKQVVQVYAERPESTVDRPVRWLVGFAPVWAEASRSARVTIQVPARAFAYWDNGWQYEPGGYTLRVGTSAVELPHTLSVELNTAKLLSTAQVR
ncbi:glycoside hydrolase family 3 C-terminal domain-containing protein [Saxibacter everestensis]|uniref:Glycoside hydrolase family 3 C-terminal domain-containing protein n=2 Tax=Saxibacter everestensis TaxID=2909229 RepID=A0ABY8QYW7_9MICO|nr:glycoside hydrolase family 3 C-terminal domain-containing protein [Brevibacteriaceae bacterium ZFBP1038]